MINVMIDPRMYGLDRFDINENLDFFRKVINLCKNKTISICLYKEILDCMSNRNIQPFPIDINMINDNSLKEQILIINSAFNKHILNDYVLVDIDDCSGNQDFNVIKNTNDDEINYDFCAMLLTRCYSNLVIDKKILVGKINSGLQLGDKFDLICSCNNNSFKETFFLVAPKEFEDKKIVAYEKLLEALDKNSLYVDSPEVERGDHHNAVQHNEIKKYSDLVAKNKRVTNILRYFGLYKIIFGRFENSPSKDIGSIEVTNVRSGKGSDIVEGMFHSVLGYRIVVELYFPVGVGYNICTYLENDFSYNKVEQLETEFALINKWS